MIQVGDLFPSREAFIEAALKERANGDVQNPNFVVVRTKSKGYGQINEVSLGCPSCLSTQNTAGPGHSKTPFNRIRAAQWALQ